MQKLPANPAGTTVGTVIAIMVVIISFACVIGLTLKNGFSKSAELNSQKYVQNLSLTSGNTSIDLSVKSDKQLVCTLDPKDKAVIIECK